LPAFVDPNRHFSPIAAAGRLSTPPMASVWPGADQHRPQSRWRVGSSSTFRKIGAQTVAAILPDKPMV
jgi:hypothetical protein